MYGVPLDLDLQRIVGHDLNFLGLGKHDVQLNFTGSGVKICIQGEISLMEDKKKIAVWNEKDNWSSLAFQKLLNATVEGYAVPNRNLLEIKFKNNLILQLHDNSDQYEAMQIYFDNNENSTVII